MKYAAWQIELDCTGLALIFNYLSLTFYFIAHPLRSYITFVSVRYTPRSIWFSLYHLFDGVNMLERQNILLLI
jgi:hypothetical protein